MRTVRGEATIRRAGFHVVLSALPSVIVEPAQCRPADGDRRGYPRGGTGGAITTPAASADAAASQEANATSPSDATAGNPRAPRITLILTTLSDFSVQLFAIASMASIGFRYSVGEIVGPLHRFWAVIVALVANFVAVPLLAFVILHVIKLDPAYAIGLVLVAAAAGAPMIIKVTEMSGGDVAFSAGLLVLLIVVSIVYMPLVVPLLSPGSEISPWAIARSSRPDDAAAADGGHCS